MRLVLLGAAWLWVLQSACSLVVGDYSTSFKEEDGASDDASMEGEGSAADRIIKEEGPDTSPPRIAQSWPERGKEIIANSFYATVVITTDELAQCKYSWDPGMDFNDMSLELLRPDQEEFSINHTVDVELIRGQAYQFYVRCQDQQNNVNVSDFPVTFSVDELKDSEGQSIKLIYRSTEKSFHDTLADGDSGLAIAGSWASFGSLDNSPKIGVGDILWVDSNSDNTCDACFMIVGRLGSLNRFAIRTVDGEHSSSGITGGNWKVCRAYTDIARALQGEEHADGCFASCPSFGDRDSWSEAAPNDLANKNAIWHIAGYNGDSPDDSWAVYRQLWKTSDEHYLKIYAPYLSNEVAESQRHQGSWNSPGFTIKKADGVAGVFVFTASQHVWIDGLKVDVTIDQTGSPNTDPPLIPYKNFMLNLNNSAESPGWLRLSNNLIRGHGPLPNPSENDALCLKTGEAIINRGIWIQASKVHAVFWNNVIFGFQRICDKLTGDAAFVWDNNDSSSVNVEFYNNTFANNQYAISGGNQASLSVINNLFFNCEKELGSGFVIDSTHNATSLAELDSTLETSDNFFGGAFFFKAASDGDFHLSPDDKAAINTGICIEQMTGYFQDDFDGEARPDCQPSLDQWDIGADEWFGMTPVLKIQ